MYVNTVFIKIFNVTFKLLIKISTMQQITYTCDICKHHIQTGTLVLNGIAVSIPYVGKLHNPWLRVLNHDLDLCPSCADKIESEFHATQLNMISKLTVSGTFGHIGTVMPVEI